MAIFSGGDVYEKLGVRHVINAMGNQTVLGGSSPSDVVRDSMEDANGSYVEMRELLEKSGEFIAKTMGTEAAYVTSGVRSRSRAEHGGLHGWRRPRPNAAIA